MPTSLTEGYPRSTGLVEVFDRVLDKGLVVAGDIRGSLAEGELLTIRTRLLICSPDKAEQVGLDWWTFDHHLVSRQAGPLHRKRGVGDPRVGATDRRADPATVDGVEVVRQGV